MRVPPEWDLSSGGRVPPSLRRSSRDLRASRKKLTNVADWVRATKSGPSGLLGRYGTSRCDLSSGLGMVAVADAFNARNPKGRFGLGVTGVPIGAWVTTGLPAGMVGM
jgi:hypothetical protein